MQVPVMSSIPCFYRLLLPDTITGTTNQTLPNRFILAHDPKCSHTIEVLLVVVIHLHTR